jgi:hypothetical protein
VTGHGDITMSGLVLLPSPRTARPLVISAEEPIQRGDEFLRAVVRQ